MKKIVGILCAAAMFTASVFAADVSVVSRFEGSLFNYTKAGGVKMLQIEDGAEYWYADFAVATWGEKAGATIVYSNGSDFEGAVNKGRMMMYFNPFEGFQIKLGFIETSLHVEHIEWWRTTAYQRVSGYGYTAMYTNGPFGIELFLNPAGSFWLEDETAKNFWLKAWFGTDVGTFGATFNAGANFEAFTALVGWDKAFGSQFLWVDAAIGVNTKADDPVTALTFAVDFSGDVDAFHHETFVEVALGAPTNINAAVEVWGRYAFALDAVTPYVVIHDENILADTFGIIVKPGISGNLGGMGWDVALEIKIIGSNLSLDVPFLTQINF